MNPSLARPSEMVSAAARVLAEAPGDLPVDLT
jgi:hypothetical protein